MVPSARAPRMLIPARPAAAAAASLRRYSAAISARETAQRLVLSAGLAARAGQTLLPDRVMVRPSSPGGAPGARDIGAYLGGILGQPVSVSLTIGPVRANRKPVLEAFDGRGRPLAFVKVGDSATAAEHVGREAEALRTLSRDQFATLAVPELISVGSWRDMTVLVMSVLPTGPQAGGERFRRLRSAALQELSAAFPAGRMPLEQTPFWAALRYGAQELGDSGLRAAFTDALDRTGRRFGAVPVNAGAWHGDCTPWNMAVRRGKLQLWDWERFELGVPVGLDAVHYALNTLVRVRGATTGTVLAGLRAGAPRFEEPGSADALLANAYLCSITLRYLRGAEGPGGDAIREKSLIMLQVLQSVAARPGGAVRG
ncbi:phosphotransferase [Paenarthrobacter sp. DKR-5]|uniref:phosphotransferase n=1 Tax=Paenarthrobacter sp. DKR-5 TaxID=2835535 RepID=UPI001BDCF1FC|nr:phosphotransferase [Paenarthrobacter sp. DKR-5]MBT1002478.1 phosphotransferase [Paenarthrobacter sp. DKR-5]